MRTPIDALPRRVSLALALAIAASAGMPGSALAPEKGAEQNSIVFILDSSGSMAAKSGGKTKMEAAKQVMTELVADLPPGVRAGLMAYGHRQKNDCRDIELLQRVEPVVKDALTRSIKSLRPLGQTPISDSIR